LQAEADMPEDPARGQSNFAPHESWYVPLSWCSAKPGSKEGRRCALSVRWHRLPNYAAPKSNIDDLGALGSLSSDAFRGFRNTRIT
jgi:hypothetical protein